MEVSDVDFIFGDRPLILEDFEQMVQIAGLKLPFIKAHFRSKHGLQKKQFQNSSWNKGLKKISKPCEEDEDQPEN